MLKIDYHKQKYLVTAFLCGLSVLLFGRNFYASIIITIFQILLIFLLILRNKLIDAIVMFTVFLSMSLEFEYTSGNFFGLKSFRILGISVAVWIIFVLFAAVFMNYNYDRCKNKTNKESSRLLKNIICLNAFAIMSGVLMILVNDNDITVNNGFWIAFVLQIYTVITLVTIPALIMGYVTSYEEGRDKLHEAIIAILVAVIFQQYFSLCLGITGSVTDQAVPLVSSVQLYGPFLVLFFLFKNHPLRVRLAVIGILGWIISFKFSQGSGQYIVLFSVPFWILVITLQRKKVNSFVKSLISVLLIAPVLIVFIKYAIDEGNVAVRYKLEQAVSFLDISRHNWRETLPMSARFRVEEMSSIFVEYLNKPYWSVFGKGVMGTIRDYTGFFSSSKWAVGTSAYSEFEWNANRFFSVHESANKLALSNGILGLFFLFKTIIKGLRGVTKSPFIAIGIMWLIWYWCYSTTISWFGIACLMLGFSEISGDTRKDKNGDLWRI